MLVGVEKARHGGHAAGIDDRADALSGCARRDFDNLAAADDDGAGLEHHAVGDDHAGVQDGGILGGHRQGQRQNHKCKQADQITFHATFPLA